MAKQIDDEKFKQIKAASGPNYKFVAAKRFKNFENIKIIIDKTKNKAIVTTHLVEKEDVKEKKERYVTLNLKEILVLPDFIKNQNLFDKISAKFYQNQGIIISLPVNQRKLDRLAQKEGQVKNDGDDVVLAEQAQEQVVITDVTEIINSANDIKIEFK